jgi:hypothetical protein
MLNPVIGLDFCFCSQIQGPADNGVGKDIRGMELSSRAGCDLLFDWLVGWVALSFLVLPCLGLALRPARSEDQSAPYQIQHKDMRPPA